MCQLTPDQLIEQDPGPLGSPHAPHGPEARTGVDADALALTAKTDSCFSSSALLHDGQLGDWPARVRYSKRWPQSRHAYSNNGM